MTYYQTLGISGADIAGATALAVIHDLKVNGNSLDGLPQILVSTGKAGGFQVKMKWGDSETGFSLSDSEAKSAVAQMKASRAHDPAIFDRVQEALASLEGRAR
ncbi:hypothetical protein [Aminobacter carboxidus]|uniref:Uncharacterized protein n=1 Tax=Aminobacter carboxidus TaxID=376165 RepID=A0ABR9GWX0_9HYPH|nr:hypothetical protein [Aminobacter carboxidus]MBE1208169.1 hypothetical protein [Aminobacter carboxidus]